MTYTVESINECTKKMQFSFENPNISDQVKKSLLEKQKQSSLKGFRKGKAPLDMIQKLYGPQIENDALMRFIQDEFFKAINEEKIQAIGQPSFSNTDYKSGEKVSFDVVIETLPEFELVDVKSWSFTKDKDEVTEEDIKKYKEQFLASKAEMVEIKDENTEVANGHFVVMNFEGEQENGEKPENMKAKDYLLEIGSNSFIPGFEEGMIGMKKGESKVIDVTFPADYHQESLQNSKVKFHTDILEIKEKKLPELTDELVKELGSESVEEFNKNTEKTLKFEKAKQVDKKLNEEILDKLVKEHKFELPKILIADQKKHIQKDMMNNLMQQGFDQKMAEQYFEKWGDDLDAKAEHQVKSGLILEKIAKKHDIEAGDADLKEKMNEMVEMTKMKIEELENYYNQSEDAKRNILYAIREEKTFSKLKELMTIK